MQNFNSQHKLRTPIKIGFLISLAVSLLSLSFILYSRSQNHQLRASVLQKALISLGVTIEEDSTVSEGPDDFDFADLKNANEENVEAPRRDKFAALPDMSEKEKNVMSSCSKGGNYYKITETLTMIREEISAAKVDHSVFDSVYDGLVNVCDETLSGSKSGGGGGGGGGGGSTTKVAGSKQTGPLWMKGLPRGDLFYVAYGSGEIRRLKIDEKSNKLFFEETIRRGLVGAKDIVLDPDHKKIVYSDMDIGEIRRLNYDGKGAEEVLVKGETKSALLAVDFEEGVVYYTCMLSDPQEEGFLKNGEKEIAADGSKIDESDPTSFTYAIKKVPLIPENIRQGSEGELVIIPEGQVQGLVISNDFLYFSDYYAGTLSRIPLRKKWTEPEVLLKNLQKPQYIVIDGNDAYITNDDGHEFVHADLLSISQDTEPTKLITGLSGFVDAVHVDGEGLFLWTDKQGMLFSASLAALQEETLPIMFDLSNTKVFQVMSAGLDKPKGFDFFLWPKSEGLSFKAFNKYNRLGQFPYIEVHEDMPWVIGKFVEPARPTDYTVVDPNPNYHYNWELAGDHGEVMKFEGPVVPNVILYRTGKHPVVLTEYDENKKIVRQLQSYAEVKYVRRELRTYYTEDREAFLNAMKTMVDTPTRQGKIIYGPRYQDMMFYVNLHNQGAGDRFCDHLHNGLGFLPEHLGLTLSMEQGMQAIDPVLVVPYWDFTIEGHEVLTTHGGDWETLWDAEVYSSGWFGDGGHNEYHTVTEGRWAWQTVEDNCWTCVHNSYGFLRAPWNINNSPYIQRWRTLGGLSSWNVHQGWPICEFHHFAITAYDTWEKFALKIASEPHGALHGVLGGTFHSDKMYDKLEEFLTYEDTVTLRAHSYNTPKNMVRTGILHCPDFCSPDKAMDDCQCSCGTDEELMKILEDPDTFDFYYQQATAGGKLETELDESEKKKLISLMCNAGTAIGDQLESASPADVIFWPMHPTIERLLLWRLLKKGFADMTWNEEKSYRGTFYKDISENCYGHGPNDVMPWFIRLDDENQRWGGYYTGAQFLVAANTAAQTYTFPFVYDYYVWPHCEEEGYDFQNI